MFNSRCEKGGDLSSSHASNSPQYFNDSLNASNASGNNVNFFNFIHFIFYLNRKS